MTKKTSITLDLPHNKHKELETIAALNDTTVSDLLLETVDIILKEHQACLSSSHVPNKETIDAIKEAETADNISECESIEKLFESLGINIKK